MEPYAAGKLAGTLFWGFILGIGIIKCFLIAKRETTCSKCVYGLMTTLLGLLFMFIVFLLKGRSTISAGLGFFFGLVLFTVLVTGIVLSIIGLVEYKKHEEYIQGRKQAITGIVISVLFIGIILSGVYSAINRRDAVVPDHLRIEREPGTVRMFRELNFKYKMPAKPWVEMNAKKVNPAAVFAMLNGRLKVFFIIVAEKGGVEIDMGSSALAEISRTNLKSLAKKADFSEEKKREVNGLTGIEFNGDAEVANRHITYHFWVCSHNGYLYQLITFGETKNKQLVQKTTADLLSHFEPLDKDKIAYSSSNPFGTFTSGKFNYTVNLKNTHWLQWKKLETDFPEAETGGLLPDGSWFGVISFYYGNQAPTMDILGTVLLRHLNVDLTGKPMENPTPVKDAGMTGKRFIKHLDVDGTNYAYYNKLLMGKDCGFLVSFVTEEKNPEAKTQADQLFNAVKFQPTPSPKNKGSKPALETLPDRERKRQATLYNQLGLFYFESKQYQKSIPLFKTAVRLNPEDHVFVSNTLNAFFQLQKYKEGLVYLETLETFPKPDQEIRAWKAAFLVHLDRTAEAITVFDKLFAENYRNDDDFIWYTQLLTDMEQGDRAAAAFEKYLEQGDSTNLRAKQADILYRLGKYRDAVKLLKDRQARGPFNADIAYSLIKNHNALEEYKKGLAVCDQLIANGFASRDAFYNKGLLQFSLKWYRKAKESFEKALEYAPDDKDILEELKYVSGLLGEGDNTILKNAITAVSMPGAVENKLPPLTAPSPRAGYGAYYISKVVGIQLQKEKDTKSVHERIKVLDAGGVSRFSTLQYNFDPLGEKIFVNRLIVRDQEGKEISRGRPSDYYVVDDQNSDTASHDKTLHIPVPNLLPGYTIEVTRTIERYGGGSRFEFCSSTLSSVYPIVFSAQYVMADLNGLSYKSTDGVKTASIDGGKLWYTENPPVYQWEPEQPFYSSFLPMVWINDAAAAWQAVGDKYLEDIREKLEMGPEEKNLAAQLTKGKTSNLQKIEALAQYIRTKYTYKAIEFGRRARIPNKASQIISNKYGDCKDHALLFHQLLGAAAVPSYLALVNLDGPVTPGMPSLDQFNHMIVYIPGKEEEGGGFMDTTDKGLDPRIRVPSNLGGKEALVLNPGGAGLIKIPDYSAGSSTISIRKNIRIVDEKEMNIRETTEMTGYSASFFRSYLKTIQTRKQSEWAHRVISHYLDSAELGTIDIKNLYDNREPLILVMNYKVADISRTPNAWESNYLESTPVKDRKTPFKLNYPFVLQSDCTLEAPAGFTVHIRENHKKNQKEQADFGQWEGRVSSSPRELNLHLECTLVPGEYSADRYSRYSKMMQKAAKSMVVEFDCREKK